MHCLTVHACAGRYMYMCIHCTHVVRVCCVLHVLTFEEVQDITAATCVNNLLVRVCVL